jgi:hypothetical protein
MQKDIRVPQHYLTPPSEGQSSPANLVLSQSLPMSRRNSGAEAIRVGQDLSVIYENTPVKYVLFRAYSEFSTTYQTDHRKSSGTLTAWSSTSHEGTYVPSTHGYDDKVEQRNDSTSSKHVFGMLKTEDGQFPFLSNLSESVIPNHFSFSVLTCSLN